MRFLLLLFFCSLFIGCSGPIQRDKHDRSPSDVVMAAYAAALSGDFDQANSYGAPDFVDHETKMRASINEGRSSPDIPSGAWPSRIFQSETPDDISIESEQWAQGNSKFVSVMVSTPKGRSELNLILIGNEWKLAGAKDLRRE